MGIGECNSYKYLVLLNHCIRIICEIPKSFSLILMQCMQCDGIEAVAAGWCTNTVLKSLPLPQVKSAI